MKKKQKLIIPFVALKEGVHEFEFNITSEFFEQFELSIIEQANLHIEVLFEKKSNLFDLKFSLKGELIRDCDRCSEPVTLKVSGDEELIVKFDENSYNESDEIMSIQNGDFELDLSEKIYEYAHSLLPSKVVHKNISDCNPEVIEKLEELSIRKETEGTDPRWDALSKLK